MLVDQSIITVYATELNRFFVVALWIIPLCFII